MSTLPKVRNLLEGHITLELDSIVRRFPTILLVSSVPRLRVELTPLLAYCHKIYKERQIDSMVVL